MNIPLLRKTAEHILAHPRQYDQSWDMAPCGTVGCIAFHALQASGVKCDDLTPDGVIVNARRLLRLTNQQENLLFFDEGPVWFRPAWEKTGTAKSRAQLAARRIEHFIQTKGRE